MDPKYDNCICCDKKLNRIKLILIQIKPFICFHFSAPQYSYCFSYCVQIQPRTEIAARFLAFVSPRPAGLRGEGAAPEPAPLGLLPRASAGTDAFPSPGGPRHTVQPGTLTGRKHRADPAPSADCRAGSLLLSSSFPPLLTVLTGGGRGCKHLLKLRGASIVLAKRGNIPGVPVPLPYTYSQVFTLKFFIRLLWEQRQNNI